MKKKNPVLRALQSNQVFQATDAESSGSWTSTHLVTRHSGGPHLALLREDEMLLWQSEWGTDREMPSVPSRFSAMLFFAVYRHLPRSLAANLLTARRECSDTVPLLRLFFCIHCPTGSHFTPAMTCLLLF